MERAHPGEDIKNHLAVITQNIEWLKDAIDFNDLADDEVTEVFAEMFAAMGEIQEIAEKLED